MTSIGLFWFTALGRLPVEFVKRIVHGDVQHEGQVRAFEGERIRKYIVISCEWIFSS